MITGFGRRIYGIAAIGLGICTLVWHDFIWQMEPPVKVPDLQLLVYCAAFAQIAGGLAIQFRGRTRAGALALAIVYAVFGLLWLPPWIRKPLVFDTLGNAFEEFALLSAALVLYGGRAARAGYYLFAFSVVSFAIYQAVHLDATAGLVPKWVPPGQMVWALVTTIAFALAALALLTRAWARLAAGLTALMLAIFGFLVWVPIVLAHPHSAFDWSELALTFGICGAAWIVADDRRR